MQKNFCYYFGHFLKTFFQNSNLKGEKVLLRGTCIISLCLSDVNILPDLLKHPVLCLEGLVCCEKNLSALFHPEGTHTVYGIQSETGILSNLFAWCACSPGSWS